MGTTMEHQHVRRARRGARARQLFAAAAALIAGTIAAPRPASALGPDEALRLEETADPFVVLLRVDRAAVANLTIDHVVRRGGPSVDTQAAPVALQGRARLDGNVDVDLPLASLRALPNGFYSVRLRVSGTRVQGNDAPFQARRLFFVQVTNGQASRVSHAAYSAATDPTVVQRDSFGNLVGMHAGYGRAGGSVSNPNPDRFDAVAPGVVPRAAIGSEKGEK